MEKIEYEILIDLADAREVNVLMQRHRLVTTQIMQLQAQITAFSEDKQLVINALNRTWKSIQQEAKLEGRLDLEAAVPVFMEVQPTGDVMRITFANGRASWIEADQQAKKSVEKALQEKVIVLDTGSKDKEKSPESQVAEITEAADCEVAEKPVLVESTVPCDKLPESGQ